MEIRTVIALMVLVVAPAHTTDPVSRFLPLSVEERAALESGQPVVTVVREPNADLGIIGAVRTTADGPRLAAWFREIAQLQRGTYIPLVQRFSDPPRIEDLSALVLDEDDLEALRDCRPGHCDLKLAAAEMTQARGAIDAAGAHWEEAAQRAFREIMLARARAHLLQGFAAAPPYDDHHRRVWPVVEFDLILTTCGLAGLRSAPIADALRHHPAGGGRPVESFLFWSKDVLGDAKPIVGITAITIFNAPSPGEPTVVASAQVFATHYLTASLSLTAIVPGDDDAGGYLVYARCSRGDLFRGPFGGLLRRIVQRRVRAEGPVMLENMRRKLEGGPPVR